MFLLIAFFLAFLLPNDGANQTAAVSVTAKPSDIYIERGDAGQHLNFDFILTNRTDEKLIVNKVELLIFDETGKLARREFCDEYGRPSLELAAVPNIEKQSQTIFYNPFHTFAAVVPLKKTALRIFIQRRSQKKLFQNRD